MSFKILTDSCCDLSAEMAARLELSVVQLSIEMDGSLALTAGAPGKQTEMLALNIYNTFYGRVGYEGVGQAKAVIFTVIVATIALLQLRLTRRKEIEQ